MALSKVVTLLSLDEFADLLHISPWSFNQLDINEFSDDLTEECEVWYQYTYQKHRHLTREVVGEAIAQAEAMLANQLSYWPAPRYLTDEKIRYPAHYDPMRWSYWFNARWKLNDVKTRYALVQKIGTEQYTEIEATEAVSFDDGDGDLIDDMFTVGPVATTVTDPAELGIYICDIDRPLYVTGEEEIWRIRPVKVDLDTVAGTVTFSGPIWLLVAPLLTHIPIVTKLDPTDTANTYVQNVKVQRRYTRGSNVGDHGYVYLEGIECYSPNCTNIEVAACFGERDWQSGRVIPEALAYSWPLGTPCCPCTDHGYAPDYVKINYLAGFPRDDRDDQFRMDRQHAMMVARLAAALLPEEACANCQEDELVKWNRFPTDEDKNMVLTDRDASNPFGQRAGAIWAWNRVCERNKYHLAGAIV